MNVDRLIQCVMRLAEYIYTVTYAGATQLVAWGFLWQQGISAQVEHT